MHDLEGDSENRLGIDGWLDNREFPKGHDHVRAKKNWRILRAVFMAIGELWLEHGVETGGEGQFGGWGERGVEAVGGVTFTRAGCRCTSAGDGGQGRRRAIVT